MGTAQPNALKDHYERMGARMGANPTMDLDTLRDMLGGLHALTAEPEGVTYQDVDANGVPGILVTPVDADAARVIVYSHGGGCVSGSAASHRKLAAHLAKAAGTHALVVDYRLAPEHPFPTQIDDMVAAHRWLRARGYAPANTATAGDSAGANLAITSVLKLRELGEPLPAAIVAISPWLDMEHLGKTLESNADSDAFISREVSEMCAAMYLADTPRNEPLANPLHADLNGMPPLFVCAGDAEALLDNAERIGDRALAAGVDVTMEIRPGQQHVYPFMAGRSVDADATIAAAAAWLRPHLGPS
jgi:acetyl esterase/lipase